MFVDIAKNWGSLPHFEEIFDWKFCGGQMTRRSLQNQDFQVMNLKFLVTNLIYTGMRIVWINYFVVSGTLYRSL